MKSTIWAIPGFLGLPMDWDFLQWKELIGVDWQAFSWDSLTGWAHQFNRWIAEQEKTNSILMGYSLGGRLALHALIDHPQQWKAAVIVSAHIGLADPQSQQKRLLQDQQWAQRFEKEDWKDLMREWNQQEVFVRDSFHFEREEHHYQRFQLTQALLQGSLGKQAYLYEQIVALPMPILWITGEYDERYCRIAQSLTFTHSHSEWKVIPQTGHRVPWAQPEIFAEVVEGFIRQSMSLEECNTKARRHKDTKTGSKVRLAT